MIRSLIILKDFVGANGREVFNSRYYLVIAERVDNGMIFRLQNPNRLPALDVGILQPESPVKDFFRLKCGQK